MKKIVLVANSSWSMIKFRYGLMKTLIEKGYKVFIIAPYDSFSKNIENLGCNFIDIKIDNKGTNPFNDILLIIKLYSIYKKIEPNLIIHYTIKPNIYGSIASKILNIKCISVIPGLGYTFINNNLTSKIAKLLYKIALKIPFEVWFINSDDINEFKTKKLVNDEKIKLINSEGVNLEYFKPRDKINTNSKIKFLLIARILKDKGIYEYISAVKKILKKYDNVEFQLLGAIYKLNPSAISEKEVFLWHKKGIINYLGEARDVRNYIANADCIILPSYREGKGMSLVEGASMGKILIATDVAGCRDVVDNGVNGFLCKVKDSNDLAKKIELVINLSVKEKLIMSQKSRDKAKKEFDENIVINRYLDMIKKLNNY